MEKEVVLTRNAPAPPAHFSQAMKAKGFVFVSGQLGRDPVKGEFVDFTIEGQTRQAIENLKAILEAGGSSLSDVVKTTVFLINRSDFASMNKIYTQYFTYAPPAPPARSCVTVSELAKDAKVEIEAIALV